MGRFNSLRRGGGTDFSPVINRNSIGKGGNGFLVGFRGREIAGGYGSDRMASRFYLRNAWRWFFRTHR